VAFMIAGIVDPCGWLSIAITSACLEFARDLDCADFLASPAFGRLLVADTAFTLVRLLLVISDSSRRFGRHIAPSPPKPRGGRTALAGKRSLIR
jgi:hypothetical protein